MLSFAKKVTAVVSLIIGKFGAVSQEPILACRNISVSFLLETRLPLRD